MDPLSHADQPNALDQLLSRIPGYRGYLDREHRRESDKLARTYLADQLRDARIGIDRLLRHLVDEGQFESLGPVERIREQLDALEMRVVTAPRGYGAFFDYVRVDRERLDEILLLDLELGKKAENVRIKAEHLQTNDPYDQALAEIAKEVATLASEFDKRRHILSGLNQ